MSETLNNKKKFQMPTALSIVMIFLGIVAIMTWFVPTSVVNDAGEIVFNAAFDADGNIIENAGTNPAGLWDFFLAPIQGLALGADVAASIFVSGAMVAVLNKTGAMDSFISALLRKFSGNTLIAMLIIIFALMGTVYGAWEELPAYAIIVVPMFLTAGYDAMTGILVILVGAVAGNMSDVVNPYAIGAAVAAIGNEELGMGSGIVLRMILFVVLVAFGIFMVLRYANKVKKDPSKSVVADIEEAKHMATEATITEGKMPKAHLWSIIVFAIVILLCVAGYAPWDSIGDGETVFNAVNAIKYGTDGSFIGDFLGMGTFCEFGWWYFNEFCVVWLIGAIIIGLINKMPEKEFVATYIQGAADLMGVVLVLCVSRGISVFMGDKYSGMSITFIYWIQNILTGVPLWAFVVAAVAVYVMIAVFLQSTSGVAGITMPIFGAIAMALFAASSAGGTGGQVLLISAFTVGVNFVCSIYPEATNMGICELTHVPYDRFVKSMIKISLPMLLISAVIISVAPYIGLV